MKQRWTVLRLGGCLVQSGTQVLTTLDHSEGLVSASEESYSPKRLCVLVQTRVISVSHLISSIYHASQWN